MRVYILVKAFFIEMYKLVKPNVMLNTKIMFSEKKVNSDNIKISFLIFILLFLSLFILSSILLTDFLNFENSFKLSILTLTNTTASSLYAIDNLLFYEMNNFTKISLISFMILGRIEIIAVLFLLKKFVYKE